MNKKFLIVGGDLRTVYLAEYFKKNNFDIKVFGIEKMDANLTVSDLTAAVKNCDIVILPLPATKENLFINAPLFSQPIKAEQLLSCITSRHTVIGGNIPNNVKNILEAKNIKYFDYFKNETLTMKNALITAEGAIMLAIQNTKISLFNSRCAILGYGRIAKFLIPVLKGFNAQLSVCARKESALAEAESLGCMSYNISQIKSAISNCDIIFNTIPHVVLTYDSLNCIKKDTLLIDLASNPGGLDTSSADILKINYIHALALPGKTAPKSAGKIIFDTICQILNQTGEDLYDFRK